MHISVPVEGTVEVINSTQISPLVSRCQIKVLYVDDKPNRNGTVITKEVAEKIGQKLPGSPIVGYYNANEKDYEQHNREFGYDEVEEKFGFIDTTKAYGFVPTDAEVWFQQFQDDNSVIRLYLCTEGIIWSEAYPETKRILESGNNQSMEFNKKTLSGNWAGELKDGKRFFIVNEAIIEKLCILGEKYEPCFEGAQIKSTFSLHEEFETLRRDMYSLIQDALKEGGFQKPMNEENQVLQLEQNPETNAEEQPAVDFACGGGSGGGSAAEKKKYKKENSEDKSDKEDSSKIEEKTESENSEIPEDKKKKEYSLDEIPEYVDLMNKYNTLQTSYDALENEKNALAAEVAPLRQFKLESDRKEKENMIAQFSMLSDADKEDVIKNIDKYSLDEIESKLSVICVRNKVNFAALEQEIPASNQNQQLTYSLSAAVETDLDSGIPAWLKAVHETAKSMN